MSVGTQRVEELAVKQSTQLIPMTLFIPKASFCYTGSHNILNLMEHLIQLQRSTCRQVLLCWITQDAEFNAAFDPIAEIHLQTRLGS
ncbi:hypothetical protein Tco_1347816 [Tanacetum coccineum]